MRALSMSLLILSTVVLLADGLAYVCVGACVVWPPPCATASLRRQIARVYLGIFKDFPMVDTAPVAEDEEAGALVGSAGVAALAWRLVAYVLIMVGLIRVTTSLFWGCGYVLLGLVTCVGEIGLLCNELLCHDSTRLHRTMAFVLHNVAISLFYIGTALPSCRV